MRDLMGLVVALCLLHGKRCRWSKLKTFAKRTNHPMEAKICTFNDACNQKLLTTVHNLLLAAGPCEKATICPYASEACKLAYNKGSPLPRMRWAFCLYGKEVKACL